MSTTINQNIRADIEKIIQQEFPGHELVVLTTRVKDKKTVSVEAGVINDKEQIAVFIDAYFENGLRDLDSWLVTETNYKLRND